MTPRGVILPNKYVNNHRNLQPICSHQDRPPAFRPAKLKVLGQDMLVKLGADTVGRRFPRLCHCVLVLLEGGPLGVVVDRPHPLLGPGGGEVTIEPAVQLCVIHMTRMQTRHACGL